MAPEAESIPRAGSTGHPDSATAGHAAPLSAPVPFTAASTKDDEHRSTQSQAAALQADPASDAVTSAPAEPQNDDHATGLTRTAITSAADSAKAVCAAGDSAAVDEAQGTDTLDAAEIEAAGWQPALQATLARAASAIRTWPWRGGEQGRAAAAGSPKGVLLSLPFTLEYIYNNIINKPASKVCFYPSLPPCT